MSGATRRAAIALAAAMIVAVPAAAKDKRPVFVESAAVKDKPAVVLDKAKAYIMIRADTAVPTYLMKVPDAADQAAYAKLRADALAEAHGKYLKKLASYNGIVKANAALPEGAPHQRPPARPVEPTEANFEFTPFGLLAAVAVGPTNRFAKEGLSTYVEEVTPGDYRIYGPLFVTPQGGVAGTCFCMGSLAFTARAGEIVDLGVVMARANAPGKGADGDSSAPAPVSEKPYFVPPPPGVAPDPRLAALPVVPARFRAAGKMPNYFGVTITRMPEMPGVLRYDRDRIVDLGG